MQDERFWKAKLLAWIHDPAEKALILLRGKSHEKGTAEALRKALLGEDYGGLPPDLDGLIRKADRWASAADRPSLPYPKDPEAPGSAKGRYLFHVVFARDPELIHPLSGRRIRLPDLTEHEDMRIQAIEAVSLNHFKDFVVRAGDGVDWRLTFLSFWRFGPEVPAKDLGALWKLLPADTRSPDHSIWEHLRLTSAFAGCLAADPEGPALLLVSFGPVQGFIAQARSVSDLWAGSHLLSRLAWEALRVVCERYGPDAVLFPELHGVPFADAWILEQIGRWPEGVPQAWKDPQGGWLTDDRNPLFLAALPNRFVALVPKGEAESLAEEIGRRVREWVRESAESALALLAQEAGIGGDLEAWAHAREQIRTQLAGFPEVHWATVPWSLAGRDTLEDARLKELLQALGGRGEYMDPGLYGLVTREIKLGDAEFYVPNPGVAYPGLHEVLERLHAAAKSARPFERADQEGWRCTLCGEREWLARSREDLLKPRGDRGEGTLWKRLADERPSFAREGEYLCALCALKRAWPDVFRKEVKNVLERAGAESPAVRRFNLSTRSVALATSVWHWLEERDEREKEDPQAACRAKRAETVLRKWVKEAEDLPKAALPYRLLGKIRRQRDKEGDRWPDVEFFKALPALQDAAKSDGEAVLRAEQIAEQLQKFLGVTPETYYGLVLVDGDRMGAWLAGDEGRLPLEFRFHSKIRGDLNRIPELRPYLKALRPGSPARHQAISSALNAFALGLARYVVEHLFMGKLIYAGGDDLLAMVSVHDLPGLMLALSRHRGTSMI